MHQLGRVQPFRFRAHTPRSTAVDFAMRELLFVADGSAQQLRLGRLLLEGAPRGLADVAFTVYGDVVPETVAGKLVASFIALAGVLLIALPLAVIGQSFVSSYNVYINAHVATEMRRKVAAKSRRESRGQRNSGQERRSSENESQPAAGVSLFQSS